MFSFPFSHPLGLVVNKSPVFIFIRTLDDRLRENSGSVNRLVASLLIDKMRMQDSAIHLSNNWGLANKSLSTGKSIISFPNTYPLVSGLSDHSGG